MAGYEIACLHLRPKQNFADLRSALAKELRVHVQELKLIRGDGKLIEKSGVEGSVAMERGISSLHDEMTKGRL